MSRNADEGKPISIGIDRDVNADLDRVLGDMNIKRGVVSRLIAWFCRQPAVLRTAIIDDVDEGAEHFYATALEELAEHLRRRGSGQNHTHGPGSSPLPPAPAAPGATKREPDPQQGRRHNTPPKVARTRGEGHSRG